MPGLGNLCLWKLSPLCHKHQFHATTSAMLSSSGFSLLPRQNFSRSGLKPAMALPDAPHTSHPSRSPASAHTPPQNPTSSLAAISAEFSAFTSLSLRREQPGWPSPGAAKQGTNPHKLPVTGVPFQTLGVSPTQRAGWALPGRPGSLRSCGVDPQLPSATPRHGALGLHVRVLPAKHWPCHPQRTLKHSG